MLIAAIVILSLIFIGSVICVVDNLEPKPAQRRVEHAREHIREIFRDAYRKMNEASGNDPFNFGGGDGW